MFNLNSTYPWSIWKLGELQLRKKKNQLQMQKLQVTF